MSVKKFELITHAVKKLILSQTGDIFSFDWDILISCFQKIP